MYYMMMTVNRSRGQQGQFIHKSDSDRQVRSLRATDWVWQAFGQYADEQGMTRADLLEQLVQQWQQNHAKPQSVLEPVDPAKTPQAIKSVSVKPPAKQVRYYLQLSYTKGKRREQWYWNGSELIPKTHLPPKQQAKIYHSRATALSAAKKLQRHVDQFAYKVKQPAELLSLKPVRVTW
jgi:hypothetical protein